MVNDRMTETLPAKRYTDEQKLEALELAALGSFQDAAKTLDMNPGTIRDWAYRTKHRDAYMRFREERQSEEQKQLANEYADLSKMALEKERQAIELMDLSILARRPETLAQTAANLSKVAASATDKMQVLRDKPTQIVGQVKTLDEIDERFARRFGERWEQAKRWDVESTAEEVT